MSSRDDLGRPNEQLNLRSWADIVGITVTPPKADKEPDLGTDLLDRPIKGSPRVFH